MQREPKTFLSKAWSGSSLAAGTQNMFAAFIKQEQALPDDVGALQQRVEDSLMLVHSVLFRMMIRRYYIPYMAGSSSTTRYVPGCQSGARLGLPFLVHFFCLQELLRSHVGMQSSLGI